MLDRVQKPRVQGGSCVGDRANGPFFVGGAGRVPASNGNDQRSTIV